MVAKFYGYNAPFFGGRQNILSRQEDDRLIKNDILQLLLTIPGERYMRPGFGTNLRLAIFDNLNDADIEILKMGIGTALANYEQRVNVEQLSIIQNNDHSLMVTLVVSMKNDPTKELKIETFIQSPTQ